MPLKIRPNAIEQDQGEFTFPGVVVTEDIVLTSGSGGFGDYNVLDPQGVLLIANDVLISAINPSNGLSTDMSLKGSTVSLIGADYTYIELDNDLKLHTFQNIPFTPIDLIVDSEGVDNAFRIFGTGGFAAFNALPVEGTQVTIKSSSQYGPQLSLVGSGTYTTLTSFDAGVGGVEGFLDIDPRPVDNSQAAFVRLFRSTDASISRFWIYKGDNTNTPVHLLGTDAVVLNDAGLNLQTIIESEGAPNAFRILGSGGYAAFNAVPTEGPILTLGGYMDYQEQGSFPATPPSGYGRFVARDDGHVYWKNDAGEVFILTSGTAGPAGESLWGQTGSAVFYEDGFVSIGQGYAGLGDESARLGIFSQGGSGSLTDKLAGIVLGDLYGSEHKSWRQHLHFTAGGYQAYFDIASLNTHWDESADGWEQDNSGYASVRTQRWSRSNAEAAGWDAIVERAGEPTNHRFLLSAGMDVNTFFHPRVTVGESYYTAHDYSQTMLTVYDDSDYSVWNPDDGYHAFASLKIQTSGSAPGLMSLQTAKFPNQTWFQNINFNAHLNPASGTWSRAIPERGGVIYQALIGGNQTSIGEYIYGDDDAFYLGHYFTKNTGTSSLHYEINPSNNDIDFSVEGQGGINLFSDASAGRIGIGTDAPARPLHVKVDSGALFLRLDGVSGSASQLEYTLDGWAGNVYLGPNSDGAFHIWNQNPSNLLIGLNATTELEIIYGEGPQLPDDRYFQFGQFTTGTAAWPAEPSAGDAIMFMQDLPWGNGLTPFLRHNGSGPWGYPQPLISRSLRDFYITDSWHLFGGSNTYAVGLQNCSTLTTGAPAINEIWCVPFIPNQRIAITSIGFRVTSAGGAGSKARVGIYDMQSQSDFMPKHLIYDSGEFSTTTTGNKQNTSISVVLEPGQMYWFAYLAGTAAPTIRTIPPAGIYPLHGVGIAATVPEVGISLTYSYAALPADMNLTSGRSDFVASSPIPAIFVTFD
jgi:hypothetical protein